MLSFKGGRTLHSRPVGKLKAGGLEGDRRWTWSELSHFSLKTLSSDKLPNLKIPYTGMWHYTEKRHRWTRSTLRQFLYHGHLFSVFFFIKYHSKRLAYTCGWQFMHLVCIFMKVRLHAYSLQQSLVGNWSGLITDHDNNKTTETCLNLYFEYVSYIYVLSPKAWM